MIQRLKLIIFSSIFFFLSLLNAKSIFRVAEKADLKSLKQMALEGADLHVKENLSERGLIHIAAINNDLKKEQMQLVNFFIKQAAHLNSLTISQKTVLDLIPVSHYKLRQFFKETMQNHAKNSKVRKKGLINLKKTMKTVGTRGK